MTISRIEPIQIAKQRVANFLIAAMCYLLLFVFIFNVKAATIELKESGSVLFASTEMVNNNSEVKKASKAESVVRKSLPNVLDNNILPPKPKFVPNMKHLTNMAQDYMPAPQSVSLLASLNLPNRLEVGNQIANNIQANEIAAKTNSEPVEPSGGMKTKENSKNEIDAAKSQYIEKVLTLIERKKSYPQRARELRMEGVVIINMKISRNGVLCAARIVKSSGNQMLDDAALNAVKNAAPFEKFPVIINNDSLSIETPVEFEIKV